VGDKQMVNEDNLDSDWLFDQCERCGIRKPTEHEEDTFLQEVGVGIALGKTIHYARTISFLKVMA